MRVLPASTFKRAQTKFKSGKIIFENALFRVLSELLPKVQMSSLAEQRTELEAKLAEIKNQEKEQALAPINECLERWRTHLLTTRTKYSDREKSKYK